MMSNGCETMNLLEHQRNEEILEEANVDCCGHEKDNVGIVAACEKRKIKQKMPQ